MGSEPGLWPSPVPGELKKLALRWFVWVSHAVEGSAAGADF
jgi:hypothetical protein